MILKYIFLFIQFPFNLTQKLNTSLGNKVSNFFLIKIQDLWTFLYAFQLSFKCRF